MLFDKKVTGGKIRFVVPAGRGKAIIKNEVPKEVVKSVMKKVFRKKT
jgi:3-dehydroquinate synthetase